MSRFVAKNANCTLLLFNTEMTDTRTATTTANLRFRPWTERLFQIAASITVLAIVLFEFGNGGLRLSGVFLAVSGGVVFAVWAARRPEAGTKRKGAFTLTCGIISLVTGLVIFFGGQTIQSALKIITAGPVVVLTMTLLAFGVVALLTGIIKRINA